MNRINYLIVIKYFFYKFFSKKHNFNLELKDLELNFKNQNFENFDKIKTLYIKISNDINFKNVSKNYY